MASLKDIQKFIQEIAKTDIVKVEVKTEEFEIKLQVKPELDAELAEKITVPTIVQAPQPVQQVAQPVANPAQAPAANQTEAAPKESKDDDLIPIKAPMVGTFYRRPAPDKPPFVEEGDEIKPGDVVCIIEAMKLFNEIESEISGTIVKILVEDATPVEFDQPLFLVKPK